MRELTVTSNTISGIDDPATCHPPPGDTISTLTAFWESGFFGNEDPAAMKFFQFGRVVADSTNIRVKRRLIRDDILNPRVVDFQTLRADGKVSTNKKARRMSYELRFSDADECQNILELVDYCVPGISEV